MRAEVVVLEAPLLDEDLSFKQGVEAFAVEALVTELAVEGLDVAVLPGAAGLDEEGLDTKTSKPVAHSMGSEFRTVVGADVDWDPAAQEEVSQAGEDLA